MHIGINSILSVLFFFLHDLLRNSLKSFISCLAYTGVNLVRALLLVLLPLLVGEAMSSMIYLNIIL